MTIQGVGTCGNGNAAEKENTPRPHFICIKRINNSHAPNKKRALRAALGSKCFIYGSLWQTNNCLKKTTHTSKYADNIIVCVSNENTNTYFRVLSIKANDTSSYSQSHNMHLGTICACTYIWIPTHNCVWVTQF